MSSQGYIIEVGGKAAGIIVREEGETLFQFHSAEMDFLSLEGRTFPDARAAERAAWAEHARRCSGHGLRTGSTQ
jgi:hypothetical protein